MERSEAGRAGEESERRRGRRERSVGSGEGGGEEWKGREDMGSGQCGGRRE